MDQLDLPKKPVITSLAGAELEIRAWQEENNFRTIEDGDGLVWNIDIRTHDHIAESREVELVLDIHSTIDAEQLVACGAYDPEKDQRLLADIGNENIALRLRPRRFVLQDEHEMATVLFQHLPPIRQHLAERSWLDVKRHLVERWIEQQHWFGKVPPEEVLHSF